MRYESGAETMMRSMVRLATVMVVATAVLVVWFAPGAAWLRYAGKHF